MSVIKLATSQTNPQKRACSTCLHVRMAYSDYARCGASGYFIKTERLHGVICGPDGKMWEPKPPRPPRRGILTALRDWLIGGW